MVVPDERCQAAATAIVKSAKTGKIGDGKVFIYQSKKQSASALKKKAKKHFNPNPTIKTQSTELMKRLLTNILLLTALLGTPMHLALGQDEAVAEVAAEAEAEAPAFTTMEEFQAMPLAYPKFMVDNLWILIAAALVFLMHLGFATIESGLTRQKNTVNILFKNVFIISMGVLTYAFWGFNSMYPGDFNGWFCIR